MDFADNHKLIGSSIGTDNKSDLKDPFNNSSDESNDPFGEDSDENQPTDFKQTSKVKNNKVSLKTPVLNDKGVSRYLPEGRRYKKMDFADNQKLIGSSIGTDNKSDLKDPFNNSSDESNDPFGEVSDENQPTNFKQTSKVKNNKVSLKTPVLNDKGVSRYLPEGFLQKHYNVLQPSNQYSCKHCDFVTTQKKYVDRHIRKLHLNIGKINQCPYCPYQSKFELRTHIISRHKKDSEIKWYRCHQCDYKAKLKGGFRRHLESHKTTEEKMGNMIKCDQCPKMFDRKCALRRHTSLVHNKHKLEMMGCYLCDYTSNSKHNLKLHIDKVHILAKIAKEENLKTLSCEKCKYKTKFEYCLKKHLEKHSKKILCEKCPYRTHSNAIMKLHIIGHQEVKNDADLKYRCDKCDYKTYRTYSFQVHKLKHLKDDEIQYFYCYHCEFKAKRKDNLKKHIQNHYKNKEFVCHICDFKTNTKISLVAHMNRHSKEQQKSLNVNEKSDPSITMRKRSNRTKKKALVEV